METSKQSTGETLFDLTSYAAVTLANLSVRQENGEVKKIRATCGLGYETPLATYDPATQSWKMSEGICRWVGQLSLANLPPSGMTRNGVLFPQPAWELITDATASSSWPTPTAVTRPMEGNVRLYRAKVQAGQMTEAEAEAMLGKSVWEAQGKIPATWPTPTHGKLAGGQGAFNRVQELYSEGIISDEERKSMQAGNGGKLNPTWVEWLMGFPPGWTDLEA